MLRQSLGLFFLLTCQLQAVTLRHGFDSADGGKLADAITHAEVVAIDIDRANGPGLTASGVLLNEHWVLTAGHVAAGAQADEVSISLRGTRREVAKVHPHPGWISAPGTGLRQAADLTLLRLETPVPGAPSVPLWQGGTDEPLIGLIAGYGKGGNGLLGAYLPGGTLRAGFNIIDRHLQSTNGAFWVTDFDSGQSRHNSLDADTVDRRYYDLGFTDPALSETVFSILGSESRALFSGLPTANDFFPGTGDYFPEATTAPGDSGSPLFIFSGARSRWELAGITSFGVNPLLPAGFTRFDSRYGDLSFFSDITTQEHWLDAAMIPEPSISLLLATGLLALRRRRKSTGSWRRAGS